MSNIKKKAPRVLSAVLSLTIICASVGTAAFSAGAKSTDSTVNTSSETDSKADTNNNGESADKALCKNETVYVIANANGSAQKVIVSDWIKNTAKAKTIEDISSLENIENVKGDETYVMNGGNMYSWSADGNDIYYQGNSSQDLPVELSITCTLDGNAVAPDSLAGKSGKLTMRFDYDNKQSEEVKIDGKDEEIYVPFVMLTGMMLDSDKCRNIEVTNGKTVNDGSHTYVAGFALPGMQENLDIDKDDLEIPDYVEVSAEVEDFELATTLTLATNEMFSDIDFTDVDDTVEDLSDSLSELTDAVDQLIDGSSQLYDGLNTLLDSSDELISGIEQLESGAQQLQSGAGSLDSGAKELSSGAGSLYGGAQSLTSGAQSVDDGVKELQGYISSLSGGLSELSANSASLNSGAKQVFDTLLSTADTQLAAAGIKADKLTVDNYTKVLSNVQSSLSEDKIRKTAYNTALETVTATVEGQRDVIRSAVEAEVRKQVTESVLSSAGYAMSADDYDSAVAAGQIPEDVQSAVTTAVAAQMSSENIQATISSLTSEKVQSLIDENMQGDEVQSQISSAVAQAKAGAKSVASLKEQLDSYNTFYQGVLSYTSGVDSASEGARQILGGAGSLKDGTGSLSSGAAELTQGAGSLSSGASELKDGTGTLLDGTNTLADGIGSLSSGSGALVDGVKQLDEGAMSLTDGLKQFKEEGIQALVDAVDGDVKGLVNRFKAISDVSAEYKSFSGIAEDMNGKVDFIYRTAAIETDEDE